MDEYQIKSTDIYRVTAFEIIADYTVRLQFNDGTEQIVDFEPILYGQIFGPLRGPALFKQVRLEENFGTLEWPNGADVDPSVLHDWPQHVDAIVERRKRQFALPS